MSAIFWEEAAVGKGCASAPLPQTPFTLSLPCLMAYGPQKKSTWRPSQHGQQSWLCSPGLEANLDGEMKAWLCRMSVLPIS